MGGVVVFSSSQQLNEVCQMRFFSSKISEAISLSKMKHAQRSGKSLFTKHFPVTPLKGKLSHFSKEIGILTRRSGVLPIVKGYKKTFYFNAAASKNSMPDINVKNTNTDNRE